MVDRTVAGLAVEDGDTASVRIEERRGLDAVAALRRADAIGAGKHEAAGMAEHIIFDVAGDRAGRRIDRHHPAAVGAAALVRAVLRDRARGSTASVPRDQLLDAPMISLSVIQPSTSANFG